MPLGHRRDREFVTLTHRGVKRQILISVFCGRIVVFLQQIADGGIVASNIVPRIHPHAQSQFFGKLRVEIRQRTKPTVVVVTGLNEIGRLSANRVHIQPVGTELKQLMAVPNALQIDGAICRRSLDGVSLRLSPPPLPKLA